MTPDTFAELLLLRRRVAVCVGCGGVGKTTVAAALALEAARRGKRALVLTIDPARRLADALGVEELGNQPQALPRAALTALGVPEQGALWALMLDMKRTFDELVERNAASPEQARRILDNRIYQYVSTSLAGTQEYMAMEKLHAMRKDPRFDVIVLDTPPTTNALDFLDAPQKLVGAIDSPVMRWFVQQLEGDSGLSLVSRGAAYVLRGLARFTGVEFLEQVGQFVSEVNALFGGFRERAQTVYDDLRGPGVAFLIVTTPAAQSVREAAFFSKKLSTYGIHARGVVVNRVHEAIPDTGAVDAAELIPYMDASDSSEATENAEALLRRMVAAAADHRATVERDREGLRRLREHLHPEDETFHYVEVPDFERDVYDLAALARVGDALLSSRNGAQRKAHAGGTDG